VFLTCFIHFLMGMDLRDTILFNSGSFAPNFWEMIKTQF